MTVACDIVGHRERHSVDRNVHSSNILDPQTLLDELNNHLEFPALSCVSRIGNRDGLAWRLIIEGIDVVLVLGGHSV